MFYRNNKLEVELNLTHELGDKFFLLDNTIPGTTGQSTTTKKTNPKNGGGKEGEGGVVTKQINDGLAEAREKEEQYKEESAKYQKQLDELEKKYTAYFESVTNIGNDKSKSNTDKTKEQESAFQSFIGGTVSAIEGTINEGVDIGEQYLARQGQLLKKKMTPAEMLSQAQIWYNELHTTFKELKEGADKKQLEFSTKAAGYVANLTEIEKQNIANQGQFATAAATKASAQTQADASKAVEALRTRSQLDSEKLKLFGQYATTYVESNKRFTQLLDDHKQDRLSLIVEKDVRNYLEYHGIAAGVNFEFTQEELKGIESSVPKNIFLADFSGLEIGSLGFERKKSKTTLGGESSEITPITLYYIAGETGEMTHSSSNNKKEEQEVIVKNGEYYFKTGEKLNEDQLSSGGVFAKAAIQGTYLLKDGSSLEAIYQKHELAEETLFETSLSKLAQANMVFFRRMENQYLARFLTNSLTTALDGNKWLNFFAKLFVGLTESGGIGKGLGAIFGKGKKGGEETSQGIDGLSDHKAEALFEALFNDNTTVITKEEKKTLEDMGVDINTVRVVSEAMKAEYTANRKGDGIKEENLEIFDNIVTAMVEASNSAIKDVDDGGLDISTSIAAASSTDEAQEAAVRDILLTTAAHMRGGNHVASPSK